MGQTLADQVAYLSYIDVFAALALFAICVMPLAFLLHNIDLSRRPQGH